MIRKNIFDVKKPRSFFEFLDSSIQTAATCRHWQLFVVVLSVAMAFFFQKPDYSLFFHNLNMPYGNALEWWLANPFQKVPVEQFFAPEDLVDGGNYFGCVSHCDKKTLRATIPILHLGFPFGLWTLLVASHLAGFCIFWMVYRLVELSSGSLVQATMACLGIATTFSGSWAFHDFICGDAVAIAFVLAGMLCRSGFLCGLFCFLGMLTDERAFFSSLFVATFRFFQVQKRESNGTEKINNLLSSAFPVFCAMAVYLSMRFVFGFLIGATTGSTMLFDIDILRRRIYTDYPFEYFKVFEFFWLFVLFFPMYCLKNKSVIAGGMFFAGTCAIILISCLVWDLERSVYYILPGLVVAISVLRGVRYRTWVLFCSIGNLVVFQVGHSLLVWLGYGVARIAN